MKDPRPPGKPLAEVTVYGTAVRVPVVLCLDTSESMQGEPITRLNQALREWADELRDDTNLAYAADVAIVTFGRGGVTVWRGPEAVTAPDADPFVQAHAFTAPKLQADDLTPLGGALECALDLVARRKQWMKKEGLHYARPQICVLTDGWPSDKWRHLRDRLTEDAKEKRYRLFAVGIGNFGDQGKDMLKELAPLFHAEIDDFRFLDFLKIMSASMNDARDRDDDDLFARRFKNLIGGGKPDGPKNAW